MYFISQMALPNKTKRLLLFSVKGTEQCHFPPFFSSFLNFAFLFKIQHSNP